MNVGSYLSACIWSVCIMRFFDLTIRWYSLRICGGLSKPIFLILYTYIHTTNDHSHNNVTYMQIFIVHGRSTRFKLSWYRLNMCVFADTYSQGADIYAKFIFFSQYEIIFFIDIAQQDKCECVNMRKWSVIFR